MKFFSAILAALLLFSSASFAGMPSSQHVFLVVEENHGYSDIINTGAMPYLSSLAAKYGLATQYYANTHPSIGNYFMLTTGQIVTNDDTFTGVINVDDIVDHLQSAGKTWKSYAESLPYAGYTAGDAYPYLKRHNPFSYFNEVVNSGEKYNLVPFPQFAADLAADALPNFSFIVPNALDDAHDGSLGQADAWLQQNIAPLLASATFQADGVLIIVFDEAETSDVQGGGGHVVAAVIGPQVKNGYQSTATYQHQSTLRSLLEALGVTSFPGAAQNAPDLSEFFAAPPPPPPPPPPHTPDFAVIASPAAATVTPGQVANYTLSATPVNGFKAPVSFGCTGLPKGTSCVFSPNNMPVATAMNIALSITTTAPMSAQFGLSKTMFAFWLPLFAVAWAGGRRKRWRAVLGTGLVIFVIAGLMIGCGGGGHGTPAMGNNATSTQGSQTSTPVGTYTVTVVATSGSMQHIIPVQLVVK